MKDLETIYSFFLKSNGVFTDTRKPIDGGIFFALKGANFDGNEYAKAAIEKGAAFAVVDNPAIAESDSFLLVKDVLDTLQKLALRYRQSFNIPIIAITGSNGKTTTKELVSSILNQKFKCHYTEGNLNNHIGVPLTLLSMPSDTEIAVIEMGANHQGEIAALCEIAEPDYGLITNIGKAHLEGFGGIEGVKKGKGELYRHLADQNGTIFVNWDEQALQEILPEIDQVVKYGNQIELNYPSPLWAKLIEADPSIKFTLSTGKSEFVVKSELFGVYNYRNILTGVAVGHYFGVPTSEIKSAIENYVAGNNRSELTTWKGMKVVLDGYNANPSSMRLALDHFAKRPEQPKIAVIGEMLELGVYAEKEHFELVAYLKQLPIQSIILVGQSFQSTATAFGIPHFQDVLVLKENWPLALDSKGVIFIKGSRGNALERLID